MALLWDSHGTLVLPWGVNWTPIVRPWDFSAAMGVPKDLRISPMGLPWYFHVDSVGFPWDFDGAYRGLLCSRGSPMGHLWDAHRAPVCDFHGTALERPWCFHGTTTVSILFSWCFHDDFIGLSWDFHGMYMASLPSRSHGASEQDK